MTLAPNKGGLLSAVSVGESIAAFARLLDASAKEVGEYETMQMLEKITASADGAIEITFLTAIKKPKIEQPKQGELL